MAADSRPMNVNSLKISKPLSPMFTGLLGDCLKCLRTSYETRKPQLVSQSHIPLGYETETEALILRRSKGCVSPTESLPTAMS